MPIFLWKSDIVKKLVLTLLSEGKNYDGGICKTTFELEWGKVVKSGNYKKVGKGLSPFQSVTDILTNPNIFR
jgi:hypothetical protein